MKKRVGIFYVNAGGGHSGTSKALARELKEKYPDQVEPILIDAMQGDPFLARWFLERGYALAINNFPQNWRIIYWFSKLKSVMRGEDKFFTRTITKNIVEKMEQEKFDVIVTVHFFLTSPVLKILQEKNLKTPVYSIVTDPFTAPPHWFINKNIKYFVLSKIAAELAEKEDINARDIITVPPLINNKFLRAREFDKKEVRNKLNFPADKKIILVVAGGDGLYGGGKIVKSLVGLPEEFIIVVVCGREQKFFKKSFVLQKKYPNKILFVYGFVDNMEELMVAADLVISKAGPATIFESLAVGRPLILTYFIWEQEKGNCDFVVDNGFGIYEPCMAKLSQTVVDYFVDKNGYQTTMEKIKLLPLKTGVEEIAKRILKTKEPE